MSSDTNFADPDATQTPSPNRDAAGPVALPGYEILGELGRGGSAVVYRARQVSLDRLVALKVVLSSIHSDAEDRARIEADAKHQPSSARSVRGCGSRAACSR